MCISAGYAKIEINPKEPEYLSGVGIDIKSKKVGRSLYGSFLRINIIISMFIWAARLHGLAGMTWLRPCWTLKTCMNLKGRFATGLITLPGI